MPYLATLPADQPGAFSVAVARAVTHLRQGGVVVAPTETFYGLLARAADAQAVAHVLRLKGRAPHKPLPLVAADATSVAGACAVSAPMARLMQIFWPGPLTLVLPARVALPAACCASNVAHAGAEVAVRVSAHPFVLAVTAALGELVTATSANVAGAPAVTTLAGVSLLHAEGVLAITAGRTPGGLPSTLVRADGNRLVVLRAGAVAAPVVKRAWAAAHG